MTGVNPPEPVSGVEAAREIVACAERTLAAASARIELHTEMKPPPDGWPRPRRAKERLAGMLSMLLLRTMWRLATRFRGAFRRRGANRMPGFEQMFGAGGFQLVGAGVAQPAQDKYMIDYGSYAKLHAEGTTFSGRSGRSLQELHPSPLGEGAGDGLWLLRLLPGTTNASPEGTDTLHGTVCRRLAAHVDMERAAAASAQQLPPPQVGSFEELRALPVTVWIDGQHVRRIRFEHGTMPKHLNTLDLWEFGVPVDDLDWSRLPAFRSPRQGEEPSPDSRGGP